MMQSKLYLFFYAFINDFIFVGGGKIMIYMDNGATSYPKPPEVIEKTIDAMTRYCANPGRAGHYMAAKTAHEIYRARLALARLFNIGDPGQLVFTKNCTEAINTALKGILTEGDHVITSSMEHNSVIRPLRELEKKGVQTTFIKCRTDGSIAPDEIKKAISCGSGKAGTGNGSGGRTKMIVMTAASNVTGTKMPIEEIGRIAVRNGIIFMVDGAQGAGHMDLDVRKNHIDILAAPGHKGLLGPQGTGFLYVRKGIELKPLTEGGTGNRSCEEEQPRDFPEGYEAGTVNAPGIIALGTAAGFINKIGIEAIEEHERRLTEKLQKGLMEIKGVSLYGPENTYKKTAVVAMNIDGMDCEEAAAVLNDKYGIAVRAGFHCSCMAHRTIGTGEIGCIRICPGFYTAEKEIDEVVAAVREIAGSRNFMV